MKSYLQEYNNQIIDAMSEDEKIVHSNYSFYTVDATISFVGYGGGGGCGWGGCILCYECFSIFTSFDIQENWWWLPSISYCVVYELSYPSEADVHPPILWYLIPILNWLSDKCCLFELWKCCYSDKCCCFCCEVCSGANAD